MAASVDAPIMSSSSSMAAGLARTDSSAAIDGLDRGAGPASGAAEFDVDTLRAYLEMLLPVVMSASERGLASSLFARSSGWRETAEAFANDPTVAVVYIDKIWAEDAGESTLDEGE